MNSSTPVELLKSLRKRKGWTQAECAKHLGVTKRAIVSWETGDRKPKPIAERAIMQFVNTDHAEMLKDSLRVLLTKIKTESPVGSSIRKHANMGLTLLKS